LRFGVETLVTYCEQEDLQKQDLATLLEPVPPTVIQPSTQVEPAPPTIIQPSTQIPIQLAITTVQAPVEDAAATVIAPIQDAAATVVAPIQDAAATIQNPAVEAVATVFQESAATNIVDSLKDTESKRSRFSPGEVLADRYRILGLLGRGGMGEVYRADDTKLGQPVALKFLNENFANDGGMLARFHGEVRAARQVTHPNVCRVHDIGEVSTTSGRLHFLSMEYVDGEDLASLLRRIGRFPEDRALEVARQICSGLAAAHDAGILHRDLKPANVMVDSRGRVHLTDFGLAGLMGQFRGRDVMSGTPAYMSPEQLGGKEVTQKSDIYALGLVLYEIFTGQKAFSAGTLAELKRMHESTAPTNPSSLVKEIDRRVESVILECLE
jgi:serine/threonine-protein kinase